MNAEKSVDKYPTGVYNIIQIDVIMIIRGDAMNEKNQQTVCKHCADKAGKENCGDCCQRIKKRDEVEYKRLINRLKRIEGQIRGITGMVESDAYCNDILVQLSAVQSAITAFTGELLESHIKSCVVNDIIDGRRETADELVSIVRRFIK